MPMFSQPNESTVATASNASPGCTSFIRFCAGIPALQGGEDVKQHTIS